MAANSYHVLKRSETTCLNSFPYDRWRCSSFRMASDRGWKSLRPVWRAHIPSPRFVSPHDSLQIGVRFAHPPSSLVSAPRIVQHGCCFGPSGLVEGPYGCLAFLFDRSLCYMSDVSAIPESTYVALGAPAPSILGGPAFEDVGDFNSHTTSSSNASSPPTTNPTSVASVSPADAVPLPILVLDTLRLLPHTSHFGIAEAVATAQRLCAQRTYLLGFTHGVT